MCADLDSIPIAALDGKLYQEETSALFPFAEAAVVMDFVHVPTCVLVQVDKSRQIVGQNPFSSATSGV